MKFFSPVRFPLTSMESRTLVFCTRGSPLALAQTRMMMETARRRFPQQRFEIKILKTTGDALQTANPADGAPVVARGLFTKELETALLSGEADVAVHSLKDLPTELPEGLHLGGVPVREDVRDVLLYRDLKMVEARRDPLAEWAPGMRDPKGFKPGTTLSGLAPGSVVSTSSPRRAAQVLALRPDLVVKPVRGNVGTRLEKLAGVWRGAGEGGSMHLMDATLLAAAGLKRLGLRIGQGGLLQQGLLRRGEEPLLPPEGLFGVMLEPEEMMPAVGQGALGMETRVDDPVATEICRALTHGNTLACVLAERAFLRAIGGGCQSPIGAHARVLGHQLVLRVIMYRDKRAIRSEGRGLPGEAEALGQDVARGILADNPIAPA